jgi:hypothetical protein
MNKQRFFAWVRNDGRLGYSVGAMPEGYDSVDPLGFNPPSAVTYKKLGEFNDRFDTEARLLEEMWSYV